MRIALAAGTAALTIAATTLLAAPARAETFAGDLCAPTDWAVVNGDAVTFALTQNCNLYEYTLGHGTPTIDYQPAGSGRLIWHQAVERTGTDCAEGWGPSWQQ